MKKKFFLSIFILLLATGCDGTYNLEIYDNRYKEDITVAENNPSNWYTTNKNGVSFNQLLTEEYNRDNFYYKKKLTSTTTTMGLNYKSDFDLDTYSSIAIPYRCYQYFTVLDEGDDIVISTSTKNICYDLYEWLDNITINVKTNHKVLDSNADSVKNGVYTWHLTRDNASNKSIQIKFSTKKFIVNYNNENLKSNLSLPLIIGIVLILAGVVLLILRMVQKNANKI